MAVATSILAQPRRQALLIFVASCLSGWMLLAGINTSAVAQEVVERTAKGQPGKDIRIGVYVNIEPDCTSGPCPAFVWSASPQTAW